MNHIYNIIFNHALGLYQVVSEHTRSKSNGQKRMVSGGASLLNNAFKIRPLALALLAASLINGLVNGLAYGQSLPVFNSAVPTEVSAAAAELTAAIDAYAQTPNATNKTALDNSQTAFDTVFASASNNGGIDHLQISTDTVYDGNNTTAKRLAVGTDKSGHISVDSGQSLTWQNSHDIQTSKLSSGGALHIDTGAVVVLDVATADPQQTAYIFMGNKASSFYAYAYGGAIFNNGRLTLNNATFEDNSALASSSSSSGAYARGGAISNENSGTLILNNGSFTDNSAVATTTHYSSSAQAQGGAIVNNFMASLVLNNATFTNNSVSTTSSSTSSSTFAEAYGGAISNSGSLVLNNVSFSGNTASVSAAATARASGGAIYNNNATIVLNINADYTSLFTGNITNNKGARAASSLFMSGDSTLTVDITQGGLLDMRDPMGGDTYNVSINISQQGAGVWKLGGDNLFTQENTGKTTFAVDKGTLYLYRAGEVDNGNSHDTTAMVGAGRIDLKGTDSSFTLGSDSANTTLIASGGNAIATDGKITLNTGDGSYNTTLSFGLMGAIAEAAPTSGHAILNLNAASGLTITGSGKLNIDLQNLAASNGKYTLLYNNSTNGDHFSATNVNTTLTLKGQAIASNSRLNNLELGINDKNIVLIQGGIYNGLATWTGAAGDDVWDIISGNWSLVDEVGTALTDTQFMDGDIVNFKDGTGGNITINAGGVGAAAIYVSGDQDYTFSGNFTKTALTTDSTISTLNGKTAASGKLVLGAMATDATAIDPTKTFTGVLDLTGINGANNFTQGVDIHSGTLKVANANQLGTSLSKLNFLSGVSTDVSTAAGNLTTAINAYAQTPNAANKTTLDNSQTAFDTAFTKDSNTGAIGTLQISGNVVLEGANGDGQRLAIQGNKSANITVDSGKSLTWLNSHNIKTNQKSEGGALFIDTGAVVVLGAATTDPEEIAYTFSGNTASASSSSAYVSAFGGAIFNNGSLVLSNATFSGNTASSSFSSLGGAIYNRGSLVLSNVTFSGNSATGIYVSGGAIDNSGNLVLSHATFTGNSASATESWGAGGAVVNFGTLIMSNVRFTSNSISSILGGAYGGAIDNEGSLVLSNATFTGNRASSFSTSASVVGGAIDNWDGSSLVLNNVSFSGNSASSAGDKAYGGAIYNDGTITLNVDAGNTSLFSGNFTDNNGTIAASSIYMSDNSTLAVNIAKGGLLDMRDPMSGHASNNNHINISQQGAGVWKLGGDNLFTQENTGKTTFAVNEGTLYLYRAGEIENANSHDAAAMVEAGRIQLDGADSSFTLGSDSANTTLIASGGNAITTDGKITLNTGDGSYNTTLSFGLMGAQSETMPTSTNAILNLNAASGLTITGSGKLNIDLQNLAASNGKYTLLYNNSTNGDHFSATNVNTTLTLKGQAIASNSRLNNLELGINDKNIVLIQGGIYNGLATWTGAAGDDVWDIISDNWSLVDEVGKALTDTQFMDGDIVNFKDGTGGNITINAGGVGAAAIYVSGTEDYTFSGNFTKTALTTDSTISTLNGKTAASGKLVLGAVATNANTIDSTQTFTKTLDLTGINGANNFTQGVDIYSGTLKVANADQLGTSLSKLNFLSDVSTDVSTAAGNLTTAINAYAQTPNAANKTTLDNSQSAFDTAFDKGSINGTIGTLQISGDVVLEGANGDTQRLEIQGKKSAHITVDKGASLTWLNSHNIKTGEDSEGGALFIDTGAVVKLSAPTTNAQDAYLFSNNSASTTSSATTYARGGAIVNSGTLTLSNAAFSANSASADSPSADAYAYGGAIYNRGTLTLTDATFSANSTSADSLSADSADAHANAYGGAIYNSRDGSLRLSNAAFSGNSASASVSNSKPVVDALGGAIYNGGRLLLSNASFTNNSAFSSGPSVSYAYGGAIANYGTIVLGSATFSGNSAIADSPYASYAYGGAIINIGSLVLSNTTFSGNSASSSGNEAFGGAIYNESGTIALNVDGGMTSLFTGNITDNNGTIAASSLYMANKSTLNVTIAKDGVLDMRDPMGGYAYNTTNHISQQGEGVWKLGGQNTFTSSGTGTNAGKTTFAVNEGTLYLYRAGEVANSNSHDTTAMVEAGRIKLEGTGSSFTLAAGATLAAGGGNAITTDGKITLASGSILGFDLAYATADGGTAGDNALLALTAGSFTIGTGITIDLLNLNAANASYTLVTGNDGNNIFSGINTTPTLRGEAIANTRAAGLSLATGTDNTSNSWITLTQSAIANAVMDWNKSGGDWNITDHNWKEANGGTKLTQFMEGDIVNFKDGKGGGNITINAGGVGAAAIYVSGTEDYTFSGNFTNTALTTDKTNSTLTGTAASGKLVLGAVATDANTIDSTQAFTGILDLTGINGTNNFAQGVDIYSGTLKVASANQLGTSLNKLGFLSGKNATSNIATLQISGNVVLEGANGDTQRLAVGANKSAHITVDSGQSLTWQNSHNIKTTQDSLGGALLINSGAVVVLGAATTNPQEAAYLFSDNKASSSSSSSSASGGAIHNENNGTLTLNNATFSGNSASSFSSTADANASGGAMSNWGTLTLNNGTFTNNSASASVSDAYAYAYGGAVDNRGSLALNNVSFMGNSASAKGATAETYGGAVYNQGSLALNVDNGNTSLFSGNFTDTNGAIAASSIYMDYDSTLAVNVAQGGVLDMRDPMSGHAYNKTQINMTKAGAGLWKLGGNNVFTQNKTGKTTFAVNEGTLYLYRAGEVANSNSHDTTAMVGAGRIQLEGAGSNFTLGSDSANTTLVASGWSTNGQNAITTDGNITLNTGDGSYNTTLSFGLTDAIAETIPTSGHAILNLKADQGLSITGGGKLNIDLQDMAASNGTYTLLYNGSPSGASFSAANVNSDLTLRGQSVASNSRLNKLGLTINDKSLVLTQDYVNALATWSGAASDGVWDILSNNWSLANEGGVALIETQFISGDAVRFNDTGNNQTITVHSGGVTPAGMVVNSGHDYTFNGGEIILSPTSTLGTALATGYLEKKGAGTLTFNNQVSGAGHIYSGTMIIGDSIVNHNARFSGNVDIYNGATLGGHGQIAGLVTAQSGATIAPGNSIGTLSVGDILFQSGSTYQFEGNTDGSGDKIIASNLLGGGTARIDSGVNLSILAGAGTWNAATTYSILEADNGVQGQFDHIQTNLAFLTPSLNYSDPNKIGLTLSRNAVEFNHVGRTFNQRNTGLGIQSLSAGHPVYNQIVSMNSEQAQNAFDNLSGEIHASLKSAALNNSRYTRNAINQHLTQNSGEGPETDRNLWVNTWYHKGYLKNDGNAQKLDNKGFGIMMGVDALSYGATTLGVALGYEQAELKLGGSQSSSADMDSMHLMAYGRTKAGPIDIRGAIGYSLLDIESKRNIGVGSLIGTNRADYEGSLIQAYIEGSHTFKAATNIDITPYINLAYQRVKMDSFTESAGLYSLGSQLKHKGGSDSQTITTLGVRGQWRINNISDLYADIGWQHAFGSQTPESSFNFIGGQPYRIKGVKTNRNAAVLGIGANFQLTPKMQLSFGYEGHLGDQSRDHSAKLQWRLNF